MSHYRDKADQRDPVTCPECGKQAAERVTQYGIRSECCGLHSWDRHPLVSQETHDARRAAHQSFDTLWPEFMSRSQAYKILAAELGITRKECHMKLMPLDLALQVPAAVVKIKRCTATSR